jgi:glycosyltransferase involved in cell wall biosynthesis
MTGTEGLRVSLDVSAVPAAPAGAGRYTLELAAALARRPDADLVLVSRRGDGGRWRELARAADGVAEDGQTPGGAAVEPRPSEVLAAAPGARPLRLAWEQMGLPRVLRRAGPDVHHGPHYTMPERARLPVVVTVHDCTFFDHPEWHERSKVVLFRRAIKVAARRAAVIICVSRTTADRLHESCPVAGPVVVAPHGVDHERFRPDEPVAGGDVAALRALHLDPDRPYVLFVGTIEPRKNVPSLVRAFDRIAAAHPETLLVIAGQRGWGADEVDRAVLSAEHHRDRVVRTGYVPDQAVPALLRRAAVVAYPSLEEGYGLPALEALACGAPLVTTSGTAMAELAGEAAVLVPPADTEDLAAALDSVLSGEGGAAVAERRRLGMAIAAERTWAASAERHMEAYRLSR